nr:hypothetical protein Iba_chr01fCG7270 [Ipomoea batatas]
MELAKLTALVASSGLEKATKPAPLLDDMVPYSENISFSFSSVMLSSRFFKYRFLLSPTHIQNLLIHCTSIQFFNRNSSIICVLEVNKPKTFRFPILILHNNSTGDRTKFIKKLVEILIRGRFRKILHINVGKLLGNIASTPFLSANKAANINLFIIYQHAIQSLDCIVRSLLCIELYKPVPFRFPIAINRNLAGKNSPKGSKCLIQSLVING